MEKIKVSANVVKETARNISDDGKQEFESALATLQIFLMSLRVQQTQDVVYLDRSQKLVKSLIWRLAERIITLRKKLSNSAKIGRPCSS
ncbi:MAG TPA: hypothetical protein DCS60_07520 [Opitutae bacterium]|nr:hypothetical protein [Opitutae bacterium]